MGNTNTGKKDPEGRTIWRGPRGALFVKKNGRNVQVATPATARAVSKWLGESSFTNHITLQDYKRKHGVELRGKFYRPEGLRKWIETGGKTVPHSGERMTNAEMRKHAPEYMARAGAVATPVPSPIFVDFVDPVTQRRVHYVFDEHTPFSTIARNFVSEHGHPVDDYTFTLVHPSGLQRLEPTSDIPMYPFARRGSVTIEAEYHPSRPRTRARR